MHNKTPFRTLLKRAMGLREVDEFMKRPFEERDFSEVPDNYTKKGPDFVGVGYPKAGTTWWWRLIREHPQFVENRLQTKETSYFQHFLYHELTKKDKETYRRAFLTPEDKICGEFSPGYITYPFALENLSSVAPDTKLIVIVRNPVDEVISAWNQVRKVRSKYMNLKGTKDYIYKTHSLFREVISNNYFQKHTCQLDKYFSKKQVLFLQFEKNQDQPLKEIQKTYDFLEIDSAYEPSIEVKEEGSAYIVDKPTKQERRRLADYLQKDVKTLDNFSENIELKYWPEFRE